MPDLPILIDGPSAFQKHFNVSRETLSRLEIYGKLLKEWQSKINLIGSGTKNQIWHRHIADSAQLVELARKDISHWLDIGSGAGLPGLIIAIMGAETADFDMHLVESNGKKCAFLRTAIRETQIKARVHHMRVEEFAATNEQKIDVITARAVAPLVNLMELCEPFFPHKPEILIQKGQDVDDELTKATKCWIISAEKIPSKIEKNSSILKIYDPVRKTS